MHEVTVSSPPPERGGLRLGEIIALVGLGLFVLVIAVMGVLVVNNAIDVAALLPATKPPATTVPGISSVSEDAPPTEAAVQPFIADEIERMSGGSMDVLHAEEQGDFRIILVIWVKEELTEAQGAELDTLLASEYAIARLVYVQYVPQLDNMVFIIHSAYDCVAMGDPEAPVRCTQDQGVTPGYLLPDDGLDLLND